MYEIILNNGDRAEAETRLDAAVALAVLVREAKLTTHTARERHVLVVLDGSQLIGPTAPRYALAKLLECGPHEASFVLGEQPT